jgi:hypothetical protein
MINLTKDLSFKGYGRFPEYYLIKENFKDRIQEMTESIQNTGRSLSNKIRG